MRRMGKNGKDACEAESVAENVTAATVMGRAWRKATKQHSACGENDRQGSGYGDVEAARCTIGDENSS